MLARPHVALVTTQGVSGHDDDRPFLDEAAARLGIDASWVSWRDRSVDWAAFDVALIHSTWDYQESCDEFLTWSQRVDALTNLCNPASIVRWSSHKGYLLDLCERGVPVVETELVRRDEPESLASVLTRRRWSTVVVKPAIGAGATGAGRWDAADRPAAEEALGALLAAGDVLVQPYLPEIEVAGETSLLWLAGEVTHAVRKVPAEGDFRVQEHLGGSERAVEPTPAELALARQAVDAANEIAPITYARIDCVTVDGAPRLMELEVLEPYLYLKLAPPHTADRLLAALLG
jgi:glutathione synthase/RimK-type ligase-like ATP-grasp enzyme